MSAVPLLMVRDLEVRFPAERSLAERWKGAPRHLDVVCGVSLDVPAGSTVALVGESGSGKTTVARSIVGLVSACCGSIRLSGRELLGKSESDLRAARREVSMVFQDPVGSLSPRRTVGAALDEALGLRGVPRGERGGEARKLLGLVGLGDAFLGRYPHQLSGGQARRVGVARALAPSPGLIIADEPTAGLDVSVQGEILNLLQDLESRLGLTLLLISHDLPVVRHVADRIAVLYLGRIVEEGPAGEVLAAPRHPYTRALIAANPAPDPDAPPLAPQLGGDVPSLLRRPSGCELHGRCPLAQEVCRVEAPLLVTEGGRSHRCHFPL